MAEVNTIDGDMDAESTHMNKWKFSGSPEDMLEYQPHVGEIRVLTVTAECTGTGIEQLASGTRRFTKWSVRETNTGNVGTLKGKKGPEVGEIPGQLSIDDDPDVEPNEEYGDYRPEDPDGDWAPPADQVAATHEGEGRAPAEVRELFSDGS